MSRITILDQGGGRFAVNSDLTFQSLDTNALKNTAFLRDGKEITIDLGHVLNIDSAGLALLIEWLKLARNRRVRLHFKNIPEQLHKLVKLSGFEAVEWLTMRPEAGHNETRIDPVIGDA